MKKLLQYLKCFLPLIAGLGLQILIAVTFSIFLTVQITMQMPGASMNDIQAAVLVRYKEVTPALILISHITTILIASFWFYFVSGKTRPGNPVKGFSLLTIPVMLLCMAGVQYVCSGFLMILSNLAPDALTGYMQLMENSGISAMDPLTLIATLLLAPIGEELLFRGITLNWTRKITSKFWAANLFQAICFGIFHANLIQGIYAMIMGLVFGYVREKYRSMYAPILLHALVNFCGVIISGILLADFEPGLGVSIAISCGAAVILAAGLKLLQKDTQNIV